MEYFGGIEAGGTKFICAIGNASGEIFHPERIETETPELTIPKVIEYFKTKEKEYPLAAMGIAAFGPVDLDKDSKTYGFITSTPKLPWKNFNFVGALKEAFALPIGFDTDVNAAALGEFRWGAGQGSTDFMYITVGTGIGAGAMINGELLHGFMHPEMGHIFVPHDKTKDPFPGVCPYHGDCLEGLATGPSMMKRWHVKDAMDLPLDHEAWDLEADYLAEALANYIMILSPKRIIMGGGVMKHQGLIEKIRPRVIQLLNGYIQHEHVLKEIEALIVPQGLVEKSGICGAIALAEKAYKSK